MGGKEVVIEGGANCSRQGLSCLCCLLFPLSPPPLLLLPPSFRPLSLNTSASRFFLQIASLSEQVCIGSERDLASSCLKFPQIASSCLRFPQVDPCCPMLPHLASCFLNLPQVASSCCVSAGMSRHCCRPSLWMEIRFVQMRNTTGH